jgi:hypothetical protein
MTTPLCSRLSALYFQARHACIGLLAASVLVAFPAGSTAATLSFECITSNSPSCESIEGAFAVEVGLFESNIGFTFYNNGLPAYDSGVIANIYFDDNKNYLGSMQIFDDLPGSGTVEFESGGSPNDLPGGNDLSPDFDATDRAGADNPRPTYGIGADEFMRIQFGLQNGGSLQTVLTALANGDLRIGFHVQSIDYARSDHSDSFVNNPYSAPSSPTPVPEPASLLLIGSGLAVVAEVVRRRRPKPMR